MIDLKRENLNDLIHAYWTNKVELAARALDKHEGQSKDLDVLLRDYRDEPIYDEREIKLRDGVDAMLDFYGIVELACMTDFVALPLPSSFAQRARGHLNLPAVKRFYEVYHPPQLLTSQFRGRLNGEQSLTVERIAQLPEAFMQFLEVSSALYQDDDVEELLTLLEGFV